MDKKKFNPDVDLYELLGVLPSSSVQEIKKAYRKKALSCHPDKNPDNPKAAELFHELANALEILIDESARAAYDRVLTAKKAAQLRHRELDAKRKKFKEDLEAREQAAKDAAAAKRGYASATDEERLQAEIARLRKEGSRMVAEELELMKEELKREAEMARNSVQYRLRLKWTTSKSDQNNGGYTYSNLFETFKKYGDILVLVMSPKKQGSALIEYSSREAAVQQLRQERIANMQNAANLLFLYYMREDAKYFKHSVQPDIYRENAFRSEKGLDSCPLTIDALGWMPVSTRTTDSPKSKDSNKTSSQRQAFSCFPAAAYSAAQPSTVHEEGRENSDFEETVLRRLREAQQKKNMESDGKE